jgi:hypothetical protein
MPPFPTDVTVAVGLKARTWPNRAGALLVAASIAFALARLVNLDADFPAFVTNSGVLYTDEGWCTKAAMQAARHHDWYAASDFNLAVNEPAGALVFFAWFRLFGVGLRSARTLIALASIWIALTTAFVVRSQCGGRAALVAAFLIFCDYHLFAYSRLALFELPMLAWVVTALALSMLSRQSFGAGRASAVGCSMLLAMLTKITAIFAFPALIVALLHGCADRARWRHLTIALGLPLLGVIGYVIFVRRMFPADFAYFLAINVEDRRAHGAAALAENLLHVVAHMGMRQPLLWLLVPWAIAAIVANRGHRSMLLSSIALAMFFAQVALLMTNSYSPSRYYLPFVLPGAILGSLAMEAAFRARTRAIALGGMLVGLSGWGVFEGWRIARYLCEPQYTFVAMVRSVTAFVHSAGPPSPVLLGNFADSIALAGDVTALNSKLGPVPLEKRLEEYSPSFYVSLSPPVDDVVARLRSTYDVEPIADYDVFGDYYAQGRVHLYRLRHVY